MSRDEHAPTDDGRASSVDEHAPAVDDHAAAAVQTPEFDQYSDDYCGGCEVGIKRLLGRDLSDYVGVKAEWLLRDLSSGWLPAGATPKLLDYGCGTGVLLASLRRLGFQGELQGADISAGMLAEAARQWQEGELPELQQIGDGGAPCADRSFDVIAVSAVFHHVMPPQRPGVFRDIARMLRPGGRVYVFEHNPLNPVTQFIVKRTPIDHDAVLLRAGEVRRGLAAANLETVRTRYLMFFPPALPWLRPLERGLGWIPMGGQYVVVGRRQESAVPDS